ncbi:MAG: thymidylate synthase [Patescibacteria group bacterium]
MKQYLELLSDVSEHGQEKTDPQGIGNIAVCGRQNRYPVSQGEFPIITTKRIPFRMVAGELIWFLRGESRVDWLRERGITIWDEWATPEACARYGLSPGDLGMIYGPLWRHWPSTGGGEIDQIAEVVKTLTSSPDSRRLVVSAWHPEFTDRVYVAPCHCFFKFFHAQGELSLHLFQRSADVFLGVPFNISSYSLLLLLVAKVTGLKPKEFIHSTSDTHIYRNHLEQCRLQLTRAPRPLPRVEIPDIPDLSLETVRQLEPEDFQLVDYDPHPRIKADVGV